MTARPRGRRRQLEDRSGARRAGRRAARVRPRAAEARRTTSAEGASTCSAACSPSARARPTDGRSPTSASSCWRASTSRARRSASQERVGARGWAAARRVGNDTFAVLRAGTERGWGVAVVCGAGINCVGVGARRPRTSASPRSARSPATGAAASTSGSPRCRPRRAAWTAAARGRRSSARCRRTSASTRRTSWPRRCTRSGSRSEGCSSSRRSSRRGRGRRGRGGDRRPARRRGRRAGARRGERLGLDARLVEVLLGGGLLQRAATPVVEAIRRGLPRRAQSRASGAPPIVGAALLALDESGRARRRRRACGASELARGGGRWLRFAYEQATRDLPGDGQPGGRRARPRHRRRRVHGPGRPVRVGQDDRAADARRARGGRRGRDLHRRARRHRSRRRRTATSRWSSRTTRSTRT